LRGSGGVTPMLWIVLCTDQPDTQRLREMHLSAHRAYLDTQEDVLVLGGARLLDDGQTATGSFFVINVQERSQAQAFSENDPFKQAGVFALVQIERLRKSQWNPATARGIAFGT
jgi:uncharacterized protein YciI